MKLRLAGFIASIWFLMSVAAAPTPASSSTQAANPSSTILAISNDYSLLDQAFKLGQKLGGREKTFFLAQLCTASVEVKAATEASQDVKAAADKVRDYSQKLWDLSSHLTSTEQDKELRVLGQKNAVTCLSSVDPQAALDRLAQIDVQPLRPDRPLYEDHRYNAAEKIFVNLVAISKSPETIDRIAAAAQSLGRTGQYPFAGIAKVIDALPASSKTQIDALLNDAIQFYEAETSFYNRDSEFFKLLQSLNNPAIDTGLLTRAFTTFAQRVKLNPIDVPGDFYAEVHTSDNKVFPFVHRPDAFLFQVYPRLQRLNAPYAAQLLQQDPKLKDAADNMTYIPGQYIQGDPTSEEAARLRSQWLQESLLARIKNCQDSKPEAAAALAQRLSDPSSRIAGFSAASSGYAPKDPTTAKTIFHDQLAQVDNLANSFGKLHATVALASAAYRIGDSNEHKALSERALNMGIGFFAADVEADRAQNRNGFADLQDLVTFTASQPSDILLAKVQQLPEGWLKAYLLLYEAVGHAKQNAAPPPPTACNE